MAINPWLAQGQTVQGIGGQGIALKQWAPPAAQQQPMAAGINPVTPQPQTGGLEPAMGSAWLQSQMPKYEQMLQNYATHNPNKTPDPAKMEQWAGKRMDRLQNLDAHGLQAVNNWQRDYTNQYAQSQVLGQPFVPPEMNRLGSQYAQANGMGAPSQAALDARTALMQDRYDAASQNGAPSYFNWNWAPQNAPRLGGQQSASSNNISERAAANLASPHTPSAGVLALLAAQGPQAARLPQEQQQQQRWDAQAANKTARRDETDQRRYNLGEKRYNNWLNNYTRDYAQSTVMNRPFEAPELGGVGQYRRQGGTVAPPSQDALASAVARIQQQYQGMNNTGYGYNFNLTPGATPRIG